MIPLTLKDKLRSRNTTRWHTVLTNIKQNVSEHSHCMAIIAETLLDMVYANKGEQPSLEERYLVLKYSISHDLPEIITGDMPAVVKLYFKRAIPDFSNILKELEYRAVPELKEFDKVFEQKYKHLPFICKAADLIEAYSFFLVAKGLDVQHNNVVVAKLRQALFNLAHTAKHVCPEYDWRAFYECLHEVEHGDSAVIHFEKLFDEIKPE